MLAGAGAGTVADQLADLTVLVPEFDGIRIGVFNKSKSRGTVQTEIADAIFQVIFVTTHCNGIHNSLSYYGAIMGNSSACGTQEIDARKSISKSSLK
jgi:hypothetical protein